MIRKSIYQPEMYDGQEQIRAMRRAITDLEFQLMPERRDDLEFRPDPEKVALYTGFVASALETIRDKVEGTI